MTLIPANSMLPRGGGAAQKKKARTTQRVIRASHLYQLA
jgi:hypothetical protein